MLTFAGRFVDRDMIARYLPAMVGHMGHYAGKEYLLSFTDLLQAVHIDDPSEADAESVDVEGELVNIENLQDGFGDSDDSSDEQQLFSLSLRDDPSEDEDDGYEDL